MAAARFAGSAGSGAAGCRAVSTLQNRQPRVQVSPAIMNVAVPRDQQSFKFGQRASSQTVCKLFFSTAPRVPLSTASGGPAGTFTRSQAGKRGRFRDAVGDDSWVISVVTVLVNRLVVGSASTGVLPGSVAESGRGTNGEEWPENG
jgi:hypothetical protein